MHIFSTLQVQNQVQKKNVITFLFGYIMLLTNGYFLDLF